jgi:hypothetical protein
MLILMLLRFQFQIVQDNLGISDQVGFNRGGVHDKKGIERRCQGVSQHSLGRLYREKVKHDAVCVVKVDSCMVVVVVDCVLISNV